MVWLGLNAEQWLEYVGFLALTALMLVSGIGVVFAPRVLHAAVWLLFCLIAVAGYYALMGAHVLFAIQILVYAGAIAVMIIFAVLLLERGVGRGILGGSRHLFAGIISAGAFVAVMLPAMAFVILRRGLSTLPTTTAHSNIATIGRLFLTRHLLAFELVSVVLLVAMVGAIVIARAQRPATAVIQTDDTVPEGPDGKGDEEK